MRSKGVAGICRSGREEIYSWQVSINRPYRRSTGSKGQDNTDMGKVTLTINSQSISAETGEKLLWAALDNGIYIPHLCAVREASAGSNGDGDRYGSAASCRLCFVEVEGRPWPVTACTEPVKEGMVVQTRSPRVDRLVQTGFALLLSAHRLDCARCPKNRACALQKIARERKLRLKLARLQPFARNLPVDESHPLFTSDPNKCVLCGRCIWACRERARGGALGFAYRGFERRMTTFENVLLAASKCTSCGECVRFCPVGALFFKNRSVE
jgi:formate dehydrogenase major subunit/NADH-quinone oxidoreductase subunit G